MWSASKRGGVRDAAGQAIGLLALSVPSFLLGSILLAVTAKEVGYNPNAKEFAPL